MVTPSNPEGFSDAELADCASVLRPYLARRVSDDQVDDLLQETLLRMHQRGARNTIESLNAYAIQTARSVMIDRGRQDKSRQRSAHIALEEEYYPVDPITPERTLIGRESIDTFVSALHEMPERTRDIFVLHRFEEMSYSAIADHMEISLSAVGKHMVRALRFFASRELP